MFKVSGATVYPTEVEQALRDIDGVDNAFVTNVTGAQGDQVGALVVCNTASQSDEQLRGSARKLLSSFKVPTVWLLVDSDDAIPRGPTGKVDVRRLQDLLADVDREASPRQEESENSQPEHRNSTQKQHQDADPSGQ
jgi:acyl-CoA synthetase (AMP-forming)/AMP-acid ligase II